MEKFLFGSFSLKYTFLPNLNFKTPMEEFNMIPQTTLKQKNIEHESLPKTPFVEKIRLFIAAPSLFVGFHETN